MTVKLFQNAFKGNVSESIAINPAHVMSVFESKSIDPESSEEEVLTNIFGVTGNTWQVTDAYLDVIARLNEKD
jgi:hypothetical protein